MNQYNFFLLPIIGCLIGYFANLLVVTMLFRPYKKLTFGKFDIPFTPGIIPKQLNNFGSSVGNAVEKALLSPEEIQSILLAPQIKTVLVHFLVSNAFAKADELTFAELLSSIDGEDSYVQLKKNATTYLSERILIAISDMDFVTILSKEKSNSSTKNLSGLFSSILNPSTFPSFSNSIEKRIKDYVAKDGLNILKPLIEREIDNIASENIAEVILASGFSQEKFQLLIDKTYEKILANHLTNIINAIDLPKIIESKICSANIKSIEKYMRSTFKNEFRLFTAIGAVVGMTIGLLSVFL